MEELVRIARDSKTADGAKVLIYSTLMPYVYPKRKVIDDSNEERATVNVETMTPEDALDLARDLISVFGPRAAARKELSAPVIEGEPNPTVEEPGHEN